MIECIVDLMDNIGSASILLFSSHNTTNAAFGRFWVILMECNMIYWVKSIYRRMLFGVLRPVVKYGNYQHESVTRDWLGWYELPIIGCIAFRNSDNQVIYRW